MSLHEQNTIDPGVSVTAVRRVLVVDDSRLQRKIVSTMLDRWGYEVMQAASGDEALAIARRFGPDLVLSDWMMPGMDGLEFCRQFRAMQIDTYGYFILLTSKSDKNEVAEGLDSGADDFLTKPVDAHELRARINAGARIVSMERELSEKNRMISNTLAKLQTVYDAIDQDLKQARLIQESLVPERTRTFGTSRVSLLLKPCGHVGGDLVGMFSPNDDQLGAYSIDVSGHGITAALVTARVAGYLSSRYPDQNLALERLSDPPFGLRPPEELAAILNERLTADAGIAEYLTMLYVTADLSSGAVQLVQAGHPPPLLLRADGSAEFIGTGGLPVGLVERAAYERQSLTMSSGDRLLLYTDGFSEAVMTNGEMLGEAGLLDLVRETARNSAGSEFLDDLFWRFSQVMPHDLGLEDDVSATLFEFDVLQPQ